jgi:hypothetical protein
MMAAGRAVRETLRSCPSRRTTPRYNVWVACDPGVVSRDDYGLCPRRQWAFAYIGHAAAGDHILFARRACRQGFLNPFDLDRLWSRRPEADKSRLPRAANRHSFWFVRGLAAVRGDMDQQELDQLVFVVGAPRDQCAFLPAEIRDPAQLVLIFRAQRQAALLGAGEETITGCAHSRGEAPWTRPSI